jgi:hypothetical protein
MDLSAMDLSTLTPFCKADAVAEAAAHGRIPFKLARVDVLMLHVNDTCPWDMVEPGIPPLTFINDVTTGMADPALAGSVTGWTTYPTKDVFTRLVDYKLPLVVLLLQAPHAPLGVRLGFFSRLHLFAGPVDTLGSYMFTLAERYSILVSVRDTMARMAGNNQPPDEAGARAVTLVLITYAAEGRQVTGEEE